MNIKQKELQLAALDWAKTAAKSLGHEDQIPILERCEEIINDEPATCHTMKEFIDQYVAFLRPRWEHAQGFNIPFDTFIEGQIEAADGVLENLDSWVYDEVRLRLEGPKMDESREDQPEHMSQQVA